MGILCVTVDLDEIGCYHSIHGLPPPAGEAARAVYARALPRVGEFFARLGLKGTLFAVGADLERADDPGRVLRDLAAAGNEIGNHTYAHRYDLTLLSEEEQGREIDRGHAAIAAATGVRPRGFRAPGYNVHLGLLDLLADRSYRYDSSVFPCPTYYLAKLAAMGVGQLRGRTSGAVVGDPRALLASTEPYRVGRDGVWSRGEGICELPISVATPARVPFIGTALVLLGKLGAGVLARAAARRGFVNLELHGIDFVDADGDGLGYLAAHQPDLRVPLTKKLAALERAVAVLLDAGQQPMPLADAAERVFV